MALFLPDKEIIVISRTPRLCAIGFLFILAAFLGTHALAAEQDGAMAQEALSLLADYIRVDTTNPPGNEIRAAEFFKAIFDREGIESQIFESAPGRANIYARLKGDGSKKDIVLMNHMDVVPVDRRYWTVDPFAGVIKDGYIWGRGALDMKSMGILELMAFLTLKREGTPGGLLGRTHPLASSSMTCNATPTNRSSSSSDAFGRSVSDHM